MEKVDRLTDSEAVKLAERKVTINILNHDDLKSDLAPVHYAQMDALAPIRIWLARTISQGGLGVTFAACCTDRDEQIHHRGDRLTIGVGLRHQLVVYSVRLRS